MTLRKFLTGITDALFALTAVTATVAVCVLLLPVAGAYLLLERLSD